MLLKSGSAMDSLRALRERSDLTSLIHSARVLVPGTRMTRCLAQHSWMQPIFEVKRTDSLRSVNLRARSSIDDARAAEMTHESAHPEVAQLKQYLGGEGERKSETCTKHRNRTLKRIGMTSVVGQSHH